MLTTFNSGALVYNEGAASHLKHPETLKNIEAPMSKQEKKIQVRFIRQTMAGGEVARVDDVATLPENEAKYLIGTGKAVEVTERGVKDVRHEKAEAPKGKNPTGGRRKAAAAGEGEDDKGAE